MHIEQAARPAQGRALLRLVLEDAAPWTFR
jgi:hypothetical protein